MTSVRQARAIRNVFLTIVSVTALMFGWVVINDVDAEPKAKITCMSGEMRDKVRGLTLVGLDNALTKRMEQLFDVWMRDEADQPARARTGTQQAISAYVRSRHYMAAWNPEVCPVQGVVE